MFKDLYSLLFVFFNDRIFSVFMPRTRTCHINKSFLHVSNCSRVFVVVRVAVRNIFCKLKQAIPPTVIDVKYGCVHVPITLLLIRVNVKISTV